VQVLQLGDALRRLIGACHHQHLAIGHESNVTIVLHQLHRPVELILEAVLAHSQVRGLADIAAIEEHSLPTDEHVAPGVIDVAYVRVLGLQGSNVVAPYSEEESSMVKQGVNRI